MKLFYRLCISFVLILSHQFSSNCYAQNNSIILNGAYIVLDGGTAANSIYLVVDQQDPAGIVRLPAGGHIHSESQFNFVKWVSETNVGSYVFPFGVGGSPTDYIPFTFNKTVGSSTITTSTWKTNIQNMPHPAATNVGAVTNMWGATDSTTYAIDRFWDIKAPSTTADLTFSYRGGENTISAPTSLIRAQHWNGSSWDEPVGPGSPGVTSGVGTAGPFTGQTTFSPWVLVGSCLVDSITQSPNICQGSSITVGTNTYTTTGVFVDNLTNTLGCDSIITTNLTVNPVSTGTDVQIACDSYTWINGNTYTVSNNTDIHTIVGVAANGCDSIITLDLTIQNHPTVDATSNSPICEGEVLNLNATGISGATYQWTGPNAYTSQDQNPVINTATIFHSGEYQIIALVGNNCADTAHINVVVNPLPILNSTVIDDQCATESGQITIDVVSPNPPITYTWSDGSTESFISGLSEGTYEITIADNVSCSVFESFYIVNSTDNCNCFVYVANAFSPNGDNNNDFIPVRGECVRELTFKIFNKWGNLVFETHELNDGWDGYYQGKLQNTGVYIYLLEATFEDGKFVSESGDISLIR